MARSRKYAEGQSPRERIIEAARSLFGSSGFHATTTDSLAKAASVSVGQIYRLFDTKDDIVLAIADERIRATIAELDAVFDVVEQDELSVFEAIKAIAKISLDNSDAALFFEMLAEASRNSAVAKKVAHMKDSYRSGVLRVARFARPDSADDELDTYADMMVATFIGLNLNAAISPPTDIDATSRNTARLMMRALGISQLDWEPKHAAA